MLHFKATERIYEQINKKYNESSSTDDLQPY